MELEWIRGLDSGQFSASHTSVPSSPGLSAAEETRVVEVAAGAFWILDSIDLQLLWLARLSASHRHWVHSGRVHLSPGSSAYTLSLLQQGRGPIMWKLSNSPHFPKTWPAWDWNSYFLLSSPGLHSDSTPPSKLKPSRAEDTPSHNNFSRKERKERMNMWAKRFLLWFRFSPEAGGAKEVSNIPDKATVCGWASSYV